MARPLRVEFRGAVYHVTTRGNARQPIFLDDTDPQTFLEVLSLMVARFTWLCHAYCLMQNHYHLLIETPEGNLSRGMKQVNGSTPATIFNATKLKFHNFNYLSTFSQGIFHFLDPEGNYRGTLPLFFLSFPARSPQQKDKELFSGIGKRRRRLSRVLTVDEAFRPVDAPRMPRVRLKSRKDKVPKNHQVYTELVRGLCRKVREERKQLSNTPKMPQNCLQTVGGSFDEPL